MKRKIDILNIIYYSQIGILAIFTTIVFFLNSTNPIAIEEEYQQVLIYIPFVVLLLSFPGSNFLFKIYIESNLKEKMALDKKINLYQIATIVRASILEMAGLFATVVAFLTARNLLLVISVFVIFLFIISRPTLFRMEQALRLKQGDLNE